MSRWGKYSMFSSRSFIVLLMFRSLICFNLIFAFDIRLRSMFIIFAYGYSAILELLLGKISLFLLNWFDTFVRNSLLHICCSGSVSFCSTDLCFFPLTNTKRYQEMALCVKNLLATQETQETTASIPGSGRSPGEGNGYPLQYLCLENPMDRSLVGYSPKDCKELDIADWLSKQASKQCDALDYCGFFINSWRQVLYVLPTFFPFKKIA